MALLGVKVKLGGVVQRVEILNNMGFSTVLVVALSMRIVGKTDRLVMMLNVMFL